MYELLGISLALAALFALNTAASLASALLWRALQTWARAWSAARRASVLFLLRVLPGITSVACVLLFLLPAYIAHEPRREAETVSLKLGVLAAISAAGLSLALWRGLAAWFATRRLVRNWIRHAEPLRLEGVSIPVYRLSHRFPVMAVVGAIRPRLFIARELFDSLSEAELASAVAHECGHLASRDNLKRSLMRVCRDALSIVPCGRRLDRAWSEAAEAAADEFAARRTPAAALDLAAALVKIARLIPPGARPGLPAGALLIGHDADGIARRVKSLVEIAGIASANHDAPAPGAAALWILIGGPLLLAAGVAAHPRALAAVHHLIEAVVSSLQ